MKEAKRLFSPPYSNEGISFCQCKFRNSSVAFMAAALLSPNAMSRTEKRSHAKSFHYIYPHEGFFPD